MDYSAFDKLCKDNGTTATALTTKLGLSKGNTSSWKKGGNPSVDVLIKLSDELNCTVDALLGRDTMVPNLSDEEIKLLELFKELSDINRARIIEKAETLLEIAAEQEEKQDKKRSEAAGSYSNKSLVALPLGNIDDTIEINYYDMPSSAGTGSFLDHTQYERTQIKRTPEAERADFAIPIVGDSMEPDFHSGDVVLVKSCPYVHKGEIGIFVLDGEAYIKQYDGDRLVSLNKKYPPLNLSNFETAVCLGRVLGIAEPV